ncbi:MAG: holo-ACP synthase [Lentisphaerae bacterium]|nr:holo-ACP synthase [Lentisphaerota bacterium]
MSEGRILGTGIDLVENERMLEMIKRWNQKFKDRVFLRREQEYCDSKAFPCHHYAGRFAVKEAVSKAFGTGFGPHLGWLDIEVIRNPESGAPSIQLSKKANEFARKYNTVDILISLTHTKHYAVAHAFLLGK